MEPIWAVLGQRSLMEHLQGVDATAARGVATCLSFRLNWLAARWSGTEVRVGAATGTAAHALVLLKVTRDTAAECC